MANDMLQLLLTGQFYESKLIYSHQGRKANLWLCRFPIHQHTFIALLVILFSNIKWVILVLLMLFFDWYIFLTLTKKKAAYTRYCILRFWLLQRAVHKAMVKNEETLISWLGVVGLRHWNPSPLSPPPLHLLPRVCNDPWSQQGWYHQRCETRRHVGT